MDDQNQTAPTNAPADPGAAPDQGTGTIFAPATADTSVNSFGLATPPPAPTIGTPPPVFAQPSMPKEPAAAPSLSSPSTLSPEPTDKPATTDAAAPTPAADGDLMAIKKAALDNLTPLVDDLDQSPEDHFKTMMMLIQASDNAELIKKAYEAANGIKDEKKRAQALLDVVNEINYFTQPKSKADASAPEETEPDL